MLKKQTGIAQKHYQILDKVYEFNKKQDETMNKVEKDDKKPTVKSNNTSDVA